MATRSRYVLHSGHERHGTSILGVTAVSHQDHFHGKSNSLETAAHSSDHRIGALLKATIDGNKKTKTKKVPVYQPGTIPCGICLKPFDPARPEALLAHLGGHFDLRYDFHKCQLCQINFVTEADLRRHLLLASRRRQCGFLFEHKQPCTGHHPPRRRLSGDVALEDKRRYSFMRHNDDARFDFCFRLRNWEQRQLQVYYHSLESMKSLNSAKWTRWASLVDVCRLSFLRRKRSYTSTSGIHATKQVKARRPPLEPTVSRRDVLGAMLLRAVCTGNLDYVASLVYAGGNVHIEDMFGFGPVHYAARYASYDVATLLLKCGAQVDKTDNHETTALAHAISIGRLDMVRCLLSLGAELQFEHLRSGIESGNIDLADILLDHWVNMRRPLNALDVLLLNTVVQRDKSMIELLLAHGARVFARDGKGRSAMSIALNTVDKEILRMLLEYGAEPDDWSAVQKEVIAEAAEYRHIAMVEVMLSKGM